MRAKKTFGQHFLKDPSVLRSIIEASQIVKNEPVLEIGPGTGALTRFLLEAGANVVAVEADGDMVKTLNSLFPELACPEESRRVEGAKDFRLVHADILSLTPQQLTELGLHDFHYKLIANIPYNITSDILRRFLTVAPRPSRLVLMVQKEVADRILAEPGEMSVLSVMCQLYARCSRICRVPAGAFLPPPKVDSTVVRLDRLPEKETLDVESIISLAKAGFSSRRKQLHGNLTAAGYSTTEEIKSILVELGLSEKARAEELSVDNWRALTLRIDHDKIL